MSERGSSQKGGRGAKGRGAARGFYVYCVGEREELGPLFDAALPETIEEDAGLEMIADSGLAAVVSAVPLADYGEESLPARLADPAWVAVRAMRHEKVVEHFARHAGVVPLRFGTLYLRREGVERMLAERQAELRAAVERLRGKEEWGVGIYCDRAKLLENIAALSPRLRELSERAAAAPPGQAYLLRKQVDALRADEARAEVGRVATEIERGLAASSDASARLQISRAETAERADLAAKFAFLVERTRFGEFRGAAERLAEEYAASGVRLELTGPWPAYNFVASS